MQNIVLRICLISIALLTTQHAHARKKTDIPAPVSSPIKNQSLGEVENQISSEETKKTGLEQTKKNIEKQINKLQLNLVKVAANIQDNESKITKLESRLERHEEEKDVLTAKIETSKKHIVQLILAIEKLEKIPFIALAAKPGAALETAQNALILTNLGQTLKIRSDNLKKHTARVQNIITHLKQDKNTLEQTKQTLKNDQAMLKRQAILKKKLLARSKADIKRQEIKIKEMAAKAKTLKDLIKKVKTPKKKTNSIEKIKKILPQFSSTKMGMPVAGKISIKYGKKDHLNADSKGIWITGRNKALVTSPYKGEIKFIGEFKTYGNIVIIEHKNDYHSLIAGLDGISVNMGDKVITGEPIGNLKQGDSSSNLAKLYFELRKSGKAIDPETKLSNL